MFHVKKLCLHTLYVGSHKNGFNFFSLTLRIYFMRQKDQATLHISYLLQRFEEELARLS